ncbi:unnamed protein product [Discosporangium mesarthrocarpum]
MGVLLAEEVALVGCQLCNNTAERGGAVSVDGSSFQVWESIFVNNKGAGDGGAIRGYAKAVINATDCSFNRNSAEVGGAINGYQTHLTVTNCNVTENHASNDGGGIRLSYFSQGLVDGGLFYFNEGQIKVRARCYYRAHYIVLYWLRGSKRYCNGSTKKCFYLNNMLLSLNILHPGSIIVQLFICLV